MRKILISVAAAAATMAIAAPASAQPYGNMTPGYAYGAPVYANRYNNFGAVRSLQVRVDAIQRQISHLARNRMITRYEYNNLIRDSRQVERAIRLNARDGRGLSPREFQRMEQRIARLEYKVQRDARDGRRWGYRW